MHTAIMKITPRNLRKTAIFIGLGCALGACQTTALTSVTPSETIMRNEVKMVRLPYTIMPEEDRTATPSAHTLGGINVFLNSVDVAHSDIILIDAPEDTAPERINSIADHLKQAGLVYGGTGTFGQTPKDGNITLYIERYIVTPPNCGNWSAEQSISQKNNSSAHHGCAMMANLGLMVANPRDLISGTNGRTSTAAAVSAIYTPSPTPTGPTMTLSVQGLPGGPTTTTVPAPVRTPPSGNQ
ncbi:CpaD family pilus assembly protein [Kordiimonas aquimaris]|uniref:CpaD family pilus assembly protein n=1 Tax=Kordiimonas aquimaris TaxID=707591 RepID=UPI0021D0FF05|nr:CpaD family pilus assembly protein [Kordiimonas aquimaris]